MPQYYSVRSSSGVIAKRKRPIGRVLSLMMVLVLGAYISWAYLVVPRHALAGTADAQAPQVASTQASLTWPSQGQAAIGAVGYGLLAQHNTEKQLATASTTKLITALCVLQKAPLSPGEAGPTITMTQRDVDRYNYYVANHGSVMTVRAGQKLSERQALEAMLLRSANNMADTLAIWAFGSLPAYATYANEFVVQHGLDQTRIGNDASGLDPSTISTADNLVKLGLLIMQDPVLSVIVGEKTASIPEVGVITNTNNFLGKDGIVGIKTGNNDQDPGAYVVAATKVVDGQELTLVGAIMGQKSIYDAKQAGRSLLNSATDDFGTKTVVRTGDVVGSYTTPWGATSNLIATQNVGVFGWRSTDIIARVSLNNVKPPLASSQTVGRILVTSTAGKQLASGTIAVSTSIPEPSLQWRLTHPLE